MHTHTHTHTKQDSPADEFFLFSRALQRMPRFFSQGFADISIVTAREPLGKYRAMILRGENKRREVLLSETGSSLLDALQLLHASSAEAVQNHISTYGYDYVRKFKRRLGKRKDANADDDSEYWSSDDSALALSDMVSNEDSDSEAGGDDAKSAAAAKGSRASRVAAKSGGRKPRSRSPSPLCADDDSSDSDVRGGARPRKGLAGSPVKFITPPPPFVHRPGNPLANMPPPPPPNWLAMNYPPAPPPPPGPLSGSAMRIPPPPMPMSLLQPATGQRKLAAAMARTSTPQPQPRDVRLHIIWPGQGDVRIFDHSAPLRRSLTDTALNYVRSHGPLFGFSDNSGADSRTWGLAATVRRAVFGAESYDMTTLLGRRLLAAL